jgi:hypothetical protein
MDAQSGAAEISIALSALEIEIQETIQTLAALTQRIIDLNQVLKGTNNSYVLDAANNIKDKTARLQAALAASKDTPGVMPPEQPVAS